MLPTGTTGPYFRGKGMPDKERQSAQTRTPPRPRLQRACALVTVLCHELQSKAADALDVGITASTDPISPATTVAIAMLRIFVNFFIKIPPYITITVAPSAGLFNEAQPAGLQFEDPGRQSLLGNLPVEE